MELALVVTTLGRVERLERLLASLQGRLVDGDAVVIVAQGRVEEVRALVGDHDLGAGRLSVVTSPRGLSRGRNVGVASLTSGGDPLVLFPNDTTFFPPGSVERLRAVPGATRLGAITVRDEHGDKFRLPPPGTALDRWNAWDVIETGLLIRRRLFEELGGFDEDLGTGATTPWQAAEGTDLLLRALSAHPEVVRTFAWLPGGPAIGGIADAHGLTRDERHRKLRAYARGMSRVVSRWRYPLWWRFAFIGGGLAFGLRHRATNDVVDGWPVFVGRLEGALGRTLGRADDHAAVRR